jgi:parallel beta-helix repeat protein
MKLTHVAALFFLLSTLNPQLSTCFAQGSLTPPGPPGPTMKTLDQVEARIPIDATHTPGDANYKYIISTAGSYYLTGNLVVTASSPNGVHVTAAGVTIDLNGFQILRILSSGGAGITIDPTAHRCVVKNGSITGFIGVGGIRAEFGAKGGVFRHLTVSGCGFGLQAGEGWQVDGCIVHDNGGAGITSSSGGNTFSNCVAYRNAEGGIFTTGTTTVTNCTASSNTGTAAATGIELTGGGSVIGCTASFNQADGIVVHGNSLVLNNVCDANGTGGTGAGILIAEGAGNRIESNNLTGNDFGVKANTAGNLIIKNSTRGNSTSFSLVAGNSVGEQINVYNGGAGAIIITSNSWANFLY